MLTLLWAACCCAQVPTGAVKSELPNTFAHVSADELREKMLTAKLFGCYAGQHKRFDQIREATDVTMLYCHVEAALNPRATREQQQAHLGTLKSRLAQADFDNGVLPPPVPEKHRKGFEAWLEEKRKEGLTTPEAILKSYREECEKEEREKKLREEQLRQKEK